jgi:hypothetical protein
MDLNDTLESVMVNITGQGQTEILPATIAFCSANCSDNLVYWSLMYDFTGKTGNYNISVISRSLSMSNSTLDTIVVKVTNLPQITLDNELEGVNLSGTIDITGHAYDTDENESVEMVEYWIMSGNDTLDNGTAFLASNPPGKDWSFSFRTARLDNNVKVFPNGPYSMVIRAHSAGAYTDLVIDFFISPESDFVTGQVLYLGGV